MDHKDAGMPTALRMTNTAVDDLETAAQAINIKCQLLAEGVRVEALSTRERSLVNLTRRHLYDYGVARPGHEIPYEVILARLPSFSELPVVARVRYNPTADWELALTDGGHVLRRQTTGECHSVEVPHISDFRGHTVNGHELDDVVQRLGYDLLGLVPTNYCSYYLNEAKCKFCEIVETFQDERPKGSPYRRTTRLLLDATEVAASLDERVTAVTYNGGQLAGHDATVKMYIDIVRGLRQRSTTRNLDTTIACMPPDQLSLLTDLSDAGLNQLFINVETMREDLLPALAPAKHARGLARMLDSMSYALKSFGLGRVYSNLVYGVQTADALGSDRDLDSRGENKVMIEAVDDLLARGIVPTYTVYHSSGRNQTGRINLSGPGLYDLTVEYGQAVWRSGLIDRSREAILFTIGSLPNTTYNDGWILAELKHRCNV